MIIIQKNKHLFTLFMVICILFSSVSFADEALQSPSSAPIVIDENLYQVLSQHFWDKARHFESLQLLKVMTIENQAETSIWLLANGDIMFHTPQMSAAYDASTEAYDFKPSFEAVKPYISIADYALANLETTTSGAKYQYSGYPAFNAPDAVLDAIKDAGYDYLSTANNHCLDRKIPGLTRTIEQIDARNLDHGGTYVSPSPDKRYIVKTVEGIKIGILSSTYGCNGYEKTIPESLFHQSVNTNDPDFLKTQLDLMAQDQLDYKIVFIHWGNEYQRSASDQQKDLAHQLIDWGADAILGSHPHVVEPSEITYKEGEAKYIIYSMGNFISNQSRVTISNSRGIYTEDGVMVYLNLIKDSQGHTRLGAVKNVPTWVHKYTQSGRLHYVIEPIDHVMKDFEIQTPLDQSLANSYARTMSLLTSYNEKTGIQLAEPEK